MHKEFIICAAIHYRDNKIYREMPLNIQSGIVVCGRRHNNCFMILKQLMPAFDENLIDKKLWICHIS